MSAVFFTASLAGLALGCGGPQEASEAPPAVTAPRALESAAAAAPVRLALEVENGEGKPLTLRAGQPYFVNQIDLRAVTTAGTDEGVSGLRTRGDFAGLGWGGVSLIEQEPVLLAGADGKYTRRRFYRDAAWMRVPSFFTVEPVDAQGRSTGEPIRLSAGSDDKRRDSDDFFVRRFRAIQWTHDCPAVDDCTGAKDFEEEALVELRSARTEAQARVFTLSPQTAALRLRWSLRPSAPYVIPVTQVARPTYGYGFNIELKALTPPRADGTYAPGSDVKFQVTLRDGEGHRLHPEGSLPTYNEVAVYGTNEAGLQYYRAFFDPTTTYYRRKHRERMMMTQIIGPAQKIQPIRTIIDMDAFLDPRDDVQTVATPERDGVFSQFMTFPPANKLFGGAFDPEHAGWAVTASDSWTYHLPPNAEPGTYIVSLKGRRVYMGEDIASAANLEIQVGSPVHTSAKLPTGNCNACHTDGGEFSKVLHGQTNRAACSGCHTPLGFELEGPIFVRVHFIHSRSDRFEVPTSKCATCHLGNDTIQRTSKAACLSCHTSYPASHEQLFGARESMYVGGGRDSFQQCTGSCHTTHPGSGF